jgi:hypothetical protein
MSGVLLVLVLQAAPDALDVVHLKSGGTRSGRIAAETSSELVLETLIKGPKGEVVGRAKVVIPKAEIDRVERASAEARRQAEERATAFSERGVRRMEALARFKPEPSTFETFSGLEAAGTHFVLHSTGDAAFVKDLAVSLEDLFGAFGRFFAVKRNADRKVRIYVLSDAAEYERFSIRRLGGRAGAIAYYHPKDNFVAAYNLIQRAEERRVRGEIAEAQKEVETYRSQLTTVDRRIEQIVRDVKQQIQAEAGELRKQIRADGAGRKEERLREIDRQERAALAELQDGKAAAQKELQEEKRKATEALDVCRRTIERNEKVLAGQNRLMFETLFHEGFHAFAANFLWEGSGQKEFPRWLHEGMACYFESAVVENGTLLHGTPHRALLRVFREQQVLRTLIPLEKILRGGPDAFSLSHPSEAERRTLAYAQSWALAHYLSSRATPAQLEGYVTDVLGGADPAQALERRLGRPLRAVEEELLRHMDGLK